jgi:hypothetical protein
MNGHKARLLRRLAEKATLGANKKTTRKVYQSLKKSSDIFIKQLQIKLA